MNERDLGMRAALARGRLSRDRNCLVPWIVQIRSGSVREAMRLMKPSAAVHPRQDRGAGDWSGTAQSGALICSASTWPRRQARARLRAWWSCRLRAVPVSALGRFDVHAYPTDSDFPCGRGGDARRHAELMSRVRVSGGVAEIVRRGERY